MIVYIAGPMRGIPEFNFPAFFDAEERLSRAGHKVISPASHDVELGFAWQGKTGHEDLTTLDFDLKAALAWDLAQVLACDTVVLLPGWENSTGTSAEVAAAKAAGIPCVPLEQLGYTAIGDTIVAHTEWNSFNSVTQTVTCAACGEKVPYVFRGASSYSEKACDKALLRHAATLVEKQTLMDAADALEGALGLPGTPKTLYEFRVWLRKRAHG